jgi:hypothetical protein
LLQQGEPAVSNAAKYCPHEHRHRGSKKARNCQEPSESHRVMVHCSHMIASKLGLRPTHLSADLRKGVLAPLNHYLTEMGFLVEPRLCAQEPETINFYRAAKGALMKHKKAIEKNPLAMRRWKAAMAKSSSAVPDIDGLVEAAAEYEKEAQLSRDDAMVPLRVKKAVETAREAHQELVAKAERLLQQAKPSAQSLADLGCEESEHLELLQSIHDTVTLIVADVAGTSETKAIAILIAAFVLCQAQGPGAMLINGDLGQHVVVVDAAWTIRDFIDHVEDLGPGVGEPTLRVPELTTGIKALLQAHHDCITALRTHAAEKEEAEERALPRVPKVADVLLLCSAFDASEDHAQLAALTQSLPSLVEALPARTLLVHRVKAVAQGSVLVPRKLRPQKPQHKTFVDVAFLMDLTGSMGSYMRAAKDHLRDIIASLQAETSVGGFRIAFVGYRDYKDHGRCVTSPFVPMKDVQEVVRFISSQEPSGGGDAPEDVISGLEALCKLSWSGDYRFVVHVADAPAHGYYIQDGADYFPSGLCPDQKVGLPQVLRRLKDDCGVDLLFCQLNNLTKQMEICFQETYGSEGYGMVPMDAGATGFKEAIVNSLSASLLLAITNDVTTSAVQTFDGSTMSATVSTWNATLRESLHHIGAALKPAKDTAVVAAADEPASEEEPAAAAAEEEKEQERATSTTEAKRRRTVAAAPARSDKSRLMADLECEELAPVRLALKMPIVDSLLVEAAKVLLRAGVTVAEMEEYEYPAAAVSALREAAGSLIQRI